MCSESSIGEMRRIIEKRGLVHTIWALGTAMKCGNMAIADTDEHSKYLTRESVKMVGEIIQNLSASVWKD